jgi:hypothetical protein
VEQSDDDDNGVVSDSGSDDVEAPPMEFPSSQDANPSDGSENEGDVPSAI